MYRATLVGTTAYRLSGAFPRSLNASSIRLTSAGPPPAAPVKPDSLTGRYEKFISRWPKIYSIHRMVVDGSRWCFSDIKTYISVRRKLSSGTPLHQLTLSQLEVSVQLPVEGPKMAVVVTLLPLPLTVYIIGFAIIFFPRWVLTRHFWTDQQRKDFFLSDVETSLKNGNDLMQLLEKPRTVDGINLPRIDDLSDSVAAQIGSLHGLYNLPGLKSRLGKRASALRQLDRTLPDYIDSLSPRQLYFHMFIRRLSYKGRTDAEIRKTLKDWKNYTSSLDGASYLVAPYFFNSRNL